MRSKIICLIFCLSFIFHFAQSQCNSYTIISSADSVCANQPFTISISTCDTGTVNAGIYSTSMASTISDGDIVNVNINGASNSSTCATLAPGAGSIVKRYSNYTPLSCFASVQRNTSVPVSVSVDGCNSVNFSYGVAVFIDFNKDGMLLPSEKVAFNTASVVTPFIFNSNALIPATAILGKTLMRVISIEGTAGTNIQPNNTYPFGETEDYTINIVDTIPGSSTITYTWLGGSPTGQNPNNSTVLDTINNTTIYTIIANDNGCIDTLYKTIYFKSGNQSINLVAMTAIDVTATPPNGMAIINVSGGTPPYMYNWTPSGGTGTTASNLSAGTYTCTITDSFGCVANYSATIINNITNLFTTTRNNILNVVPNPAQNYVLIKSSNQFNKVEIKNTLGQVVFSSKYTPTKTTRISTANLPNGIYELQTNNSASYKLQVIH